jgi:hypothetical protein
MVARTAVPKNTRFFTPIPLLLFHSLLAVITIEPIEPVAKALNRGNIGGI